MAYQVRDLSDYLVPQSEAGLADNPLTEDVNAIIRSEYQRLLKANGDDAKREMEDGLYFAAKKRMRLRKFSGDRNTYLMGLMTDIQDAGREFGEVAYESERTRDVFWNLKMGIMELLSH